MNFISKVINSTTIIEVNCQRATISVVDEFKPFMQELLDQGNNKLVVDLTNCMFLDSSFLGTLVSILKKVVSLDGDMKLVGISGPVKSMFELTRMTRVFEIFESLNDAVESF